MECEEAAKAQTPQPNAKEQLEQVAAKEHSVSRHFSPLKRNVLLKEDSSKVQAESLFVTMFVMLKLNLLPSQNILTSCPIDSSVTSCKHSIDAQVELFSHNVLLVQLEPSKQFKVMLIVELWRR
jgi:hypothetical protein